MCADGILSGRNVNTSDITLSNLEEEIYENWPIAGGPQNNSNHYQDENKIPDTSFIQVTSETKIPKNTEIEIDNLEIDDKPLTRITIHEIIPDVKEIPITAPPKVDSVQGQLMIEEQDVGQNSSNDLVTDAEPDSSEILEIFHPPPPVLRVGDKLIFLKNQPGNNNENSTPSSVITVIGAEYLQRGGMEESAEETNSSTTSAITENSTNSVELKASESTHILSLVKRKKPECETTTTEPSTTTTTTTESSTTTETPTTITEETTTVIIDEISTQTDQTEENIENSTIGQPEIKIIEERNPAYPTIPDVMTTISDDPSQRFVTEKPKDPLQMDIKILPEVLEIRNNKTIPENTTNSEWLKKDIDGNVEALNQTTTIPSTTTESTEETTTVTSRSVETVEESTEDSGEATTPKDTKAAIISSENASVEELTKEDLEIIDMLSAKEVTEDELLERTTPPPPTMTDIMEKSNENDTKIQDVEIISIGEMDKKISKNTLPISETDKIVPETLPKPEKLIKIVGKRANSEDDEAEAVFKQLNDELFAESTQRILTKEEEEKEAEAIFRELLEETSTPPSKPKNKETEALQRVTDALAQLTLRGKQPNSNILSTLSNFFGSLRYYDKK